MRIRKVFPFMMCISVLLSSLVFLQTLRTEKVEANADESFPPVIQDFSINDTRCNAVAQWNYSLTDSNGLQNATMWWSNGTSDMGNTTYTFSGSPQSGNALFNNTLPTTAQNVTFQCWAYNGYNWSTTGVRWMLVYPSNSSNPYFLNLGTAISTVENANNWTSATSDPSGLYAGMVLNQNTTAQMQSYIDGLVPYYSQVATLSYGNSASGTSWANPSSAIDNDTGTGTSYTKAGAGWTNTITLNMTFSTLGSSITSMQYFSLGAFTTMSVEIANQTGSWFSVYSNTPSYSFTVWWNVTFSQSSYTAMRFSFYCSVAGSVILFEARGWNDTVLVNPPSTVYHQDLTYGNSASGTSWTTPSAAIDNSTADWAAYDGSGGWTTYLTVNMTYTTTGNTIDYNLQQAGSVTTTMTADIANQTGSWLNVYNSTPTYDNSWYNFTFTLSTYTAIRFNFYQTGISHTYVDEVRAYTYSVEYDWIDVLKWTAICDKLGITSNSNIQQDINYALGNYTMIANLPLTQSKWVSNGFCTENQWALYGFKYANTSWAQVYNSSFGVTAWNITLAFQQFNTSVYYSVYNDSGHGLPLWIYSDNTGKTSTDRYYDEDANTIECYLLFSQLLNVSGAMAEALKWWSYLVNTHWTGTYFKYTPQLSFYECEAPFFLEIISMLKYYNAGLGNWTDVLTDIGNRFLSLEWTSAQWYHNVVLHANPGNYQLRLQNTVGAWQVLVGVFMQLNNTYQNNVKDMLLGNTNTHQAWNLVLQSALYSNTEYRFYMLSTNMQTDPVATAWGEVLMWMMGIVPGNTTVAFPLEELNYEYIQSIDPAIFQMNCNSTLRKITIPVNSAGTITFQYGCSPITYYFNNSGLWQINFANSWNNILNASCVGDLPNNLIYFQNIVSMPTHDVAVTGVAPSKTVTGTGCSDNVTVLVADRGDSAETFNVTAYANSTVLGTEQVSLNATDQTTLTFAWNTTGLAYGNYTLSAYAWPVPNETTTADNNFTGGAVTVTLPGDINCDFTVDARDLVLLANAYGTSPSKPISGKCVWNPNADVDGDGVVGLIDLVILANHYGQHYP